MTAWTPLDVRYRLAEAADTLRRLPMPARGRPPRAAQALAARWPDTVLAAIDAYGYGRTRLRPAAPAPHDIRRMDEALCWLWWIEGERRRIVWARACGVPWRRLEDIDGRSDRTLRARYQTGIAAIAWRLNGTVKNILPEFPENGRVGAA